MTHIDATGLETLEGIVDDLAKNRITFVVGTHHLHPTVAGAVAACGAGRPEQ